MAVQSQPLPGSPIGTTYISDSSVNATAQAAKASSSATLFALEIDNTANSSAMYFKMYDVATAGVAHVTVGTTDPDFIFVIPASSKRQFNALEGLNFTTGMIYACLTTGGTGGTASPGSAVSIKMFIS
tara:strand:+ start:8 stop:391 length:384 start_codon:yes stop_codon:yes gene_type:complete